MSKTFMRCIYPIQLHYFMKNKNITSLLFTLSLVLIVGLTFIPKASASAEKCATYSCLRVRGDGLYVGYVQAGVLVPMRQDFYGHFEIWGSGFHKTFSPYHYRNNSWWHWETFWGPPVPINRNLPDGSKVCATSGYGGRICADIHR